jgi:hypothetical protein
VSQRKRQASPSGYRNAVSDKFISRATARIQSSSAGTSSTQTAAGFPANGRSLKASTTMNF